MTGPDVVRIPLDKGSAKIDTKRGTLSLLDDTDTCCLNFPLVPHIDYLDQDSGAAGPASYHFASDKHLVLRASDALLSKEVHLQIGEGTIDYWVEIRVIDAAAPVRCVHYGQSDSPFQSAAEHSFDEFFILCPDRYGTCIPRKGTVSLKLGVPSFRFSKENNFPHEGGRAMISPYVTALRSASTWFGIGTLEIPASDYGLNMTFRDGHVAIDFYYGVNLTVKETYRLPRITFFASEDKLTTVRTYINRLYAEGRAQPPTAWDPSWSGPIYCFFSDQMYEYQTDRSTQELQGEMTMTENYCNEEFLNRCLAFLEEKAIHYSTIIMDYGWFVMNGEWRPHLTRFRNFRQTIRRLQEKGKKVLVWYSPYFNAQQSVNYRNHPEIGVKKADGTPFSVVRFGSEVNYQSDFTHHAMRELCRQDFEFMLGADGLNADGIKIDCTHQPPTIDNVFHDPSWGTGELFHYRASQFMYETAKRIKPDCCINATAGNPLFNGTYDLHRIHDAMEYNLDSYEERAWAAWMCGAGIADLDDWPSYDLYTVRANLRKICYGVPSLYAARKRAGERKPKASWGYAYSVSEDELQLLSSIYELYSQVPIDIVQDITVDPFVKVFERRYQEGPLAGFYAATTLSGNQAVAVYTPAQAHIVGISDSPVAIPLPPRSKDHRSFMTLRNASAVPVEHVVGPDGTIILDIQRCCGPIRKYTVTYSLS